MLIDPKKFAGPRKRSVELLVEKRKAKGLGQTRLAEILGRPRAWVARLESGRRQRVDVFEFFVLAKLDFGQKLTGSSRPRNAEHWIAFDDLVSALEHELHAAEVSEGAPPAVDV